MGMFDALKRGLNKFKKEAEEAETEVEFEVVRERPAARAEKPAATHPAAPKAPTPPKAAAKPQPAPKAPPAPEKPAPPAAKRPPTYKVVHHTEVEKEIAAKHFDEELQKAVTPPDGFEPEHDLQGAEFEEGDRSRVPVPREPRPQVAIEEPARPTAVRGKGIDPRRVDDLLFDLEVSLLEADVALPTVEAIRRELEARLPKIRVERTEAIPAAVEDALRDALLKVLSVGRVDFDEVVMERAKPVVVMFVGVNGTGKTTAIGRIAHRLKENGFSSAMAAGDTFRAGAIEQLERHGENLGITVIKGQAGGDPAAVAYDAVEHAKARKKDVVLLDTAGRMQTNTNLMDEMKKIKRVAKPDLIVFVGDSLAGNDAIDQATAFDKAVGIDAVILTKVDTDAKGGAALSIAQAVGKPILFLGVGQEYSDLIPYDPEWMVARIFD